MTIPEIEDDTAEGKMFLKSEFAKSGSSYRSPWSHKFFPDAKGQLPSPELLDLEEQANDIFERYAFMYYGEQAVSSVFFFDTDFDGYGACYLIKNGKSF